jgi:FAD/FMN-containing dehydrogenase
VTGPPPHPQQAFAAARERIRSEYAEVPSGVPVRLGKRTSNLFRSREGRAVRLDVSGLDQTLRVDPRDRTADVGAMTTYEQLVSATLPHGLMPLVVPQLRTITLGGAVTGLGIESSSFRNGMPHESVLEAEILTGGGEIVIARPDGEHSDLYRAFPNSYGTLGYALRLLIELQPVKRFVSLRHLHFKSAADAAGAITELCEQPATDFLDGVAFSPAEIYLTVGSFTDAADRRPSRYTGREIYYRSLRERCEDRLTAHDYLWRWDTDWFWCSKAFGAQHPLVRAVWPARYRRSDVFWRLVSLDERYGVSPRLDRWLGRPRREKVIQDVEVPVSQLADFLPELDAITGLRPVWLCPIRRRAGSPDWPLYPLKDGQMYVNLGFWGTVPVGADEEPGSRNRRVEQAVDRFGGAKSLYSTATYGREEFDTHYGGPAYRQVKERYDPGGRLLDLYEKVVLTR